MPIIEIEKEVPVSEKDKVYEIITKKYSLPDKIFMADESGETTLLYYDSRRREYRSANRDKTIGSVEYLESVLDKSKSHEDNEDEKSL